MWPGGLKPETKGSPGRGKQHIEKQQQQQKQKNRKQDREEHYKDRTD